MRKVILYIAMSLDGYIADENGKVDWLTGQDCNVEGVDSFADFEKSIDTVIMGWSTYHQIVTELSPDYWVYPNQHSYVITHRNRPSTENITFTSKSPSLLINELKHDSGKDIWICGGANIVHQLMEDNLIDRYHISIIPTILGNGIQLFSKRNQEIKPRLLDMKSDNGITELIYEKR